MGGFDYLIYKIDDAFPRTVGELMATAKKKMLKQSGRSLREFNSLWYNEETSIEIKIVPEEGIYCQMDW